MTNGSTRQQLISGVLWLTVARALSQSVTWIITIFVVRLLTPEDYGLMGMALLVSGFLSLFSEFGLGTAIVQRANLADADLSNLRWLIFGVNFLFFVLLASSAPGVAAYFSEPRLTTMVQVLATAFVLQGIGGASAHLLQRGMAFRAKAFSELVGSVAGGVSTLSAAVAGFGVWSLVLGYLLQQFVTNVLYCVRAPVPLRFSFSTSGIGSYVSFGGQIALSRILWYIASNADFVVIGRMLGSVQLGFYGLAFQFATIPIDRIVTIVSQVALPSFATLQNDDATLTRYFLKLTSIIALVTFPILVGMALVADTAVPLLLTSKWLPIVVPLQILCIVSCFRAVEMLCHPLSVSKGNAKVSLFNGLLQAVVLPLAFYIGARYDGLRGVALAWLVTRPLLFAFVTTMSIHTIGLRFSGYIYVLRHAIGGSVAMGAAILGLHPLVAGTPPVVRLVATCISGFAVYAAYQLLFNRHALGEGLAIIRAPRTMASPGVASGGAPA